MLQLNLSRKLTRIIGLWMFAMLSSILLIAQQPTNGNVGIGTEKPDKSAILDLTSTSSGFLVPRMTLVQRGNIQNPANGLLVYQTDFFSGFYFYDGSKWKMFYTRTPDGIGSNNLPSDSETSWNLNGNSGLDPNNNFLGTKDTVNLVFRVNNYRSGLIDYKTLNTYLGYRAGFRAKGLNSVALGAYAMQDANVGLNNVAIGYATMLSNQAGNDNIGIGATALSSNLNGSKNIAIGTLAGSKILGNGNILIGYNAGLLETGSNKLYIDNNGNTTPLIYGEFDTFRIGINTKSPNSSLSIDSKVANTSGLEFKQLNSNSPAAKSNKKVLSVDENGKVILVEANEGGTNNSAIHWTSSGVGISNTNTGIVNIKNGLVVDNGALVNQKFEINSGVANSSGFMLSQLKSTSPTVASNSKVLSVDENGNVILVADAVGNASDIAKLWKINGDNLFNANAGNVLITNNLTLGKYKSSSPTVASNSKVLSVDTDGNIILVPDQVGTNSVSTQWTASGNEISNGNAGKVNITAGLKLNLKSNSPTSPSNSRVLTVDADGNVILTPDQIGQATSSQWAESGNDLSNINSGKVRIANLTLGIKATNPTSPSNTKVLSVDNDGNVVLVPDQIGIPTPTQWTLNGNEIVNNNAGKVSIGAGLKLNLKSTSQTSPSNSRVLTVDSDGNVILAPDQIGQATTSQWAESGNDLSNINSGKVRITNLTLGLKGTSPTSASNSKVLTVDNDGNVILAPDQVGQAAPTQWNIVGNEIANANAGKVSITNGLKLNLKSTNAAVASNSKVLSVDADGNVVLASDQVGVATPSQWTLNGNEIINNNAGKVSIGAGLKLNLKSTSQTSPSNSRVLTVDADGNVILAPDQIGQATSSQWAESGNDLSNINSGKVRITNLTLGLKGTSATVASNSKVLTVDNDGNVVLAPDQVGQATPTQWNIVGNEIANANAGKVSITNGLKLNLKSTSAAVASNSKVLSVDADGNVVLANEQVAQAVSSQWTLNGTEIVNNNAGIVKIGAGLKLNLKSTSATVASNAKVLSVDTDGNVVLTTDQTGIAGTSNWTENGTDISNSNTGKVKINNLTLGIKGTSPTTTSNSKVLSVDNDGNVVLVPDQIGQAGASQWNTTGDDISNTNNGKVLINNDLTFSKIKSTNPTVASNSKVLSVDENGKVILVPDQVGQAGATSPWSATGNDISNSNTGKVILKSGLNFSNLNNTSATTISSDKVLSVDAGGNVILVNNASDASAGNTLPWKVDGQGMVNTNAGGIFINGGGANKSGLQFVNLKASSPTVNGYGKVLSIDDSGNIIFVNDLQGAATSQLWYEADGRAHRDSKVAIGGGIPSFPNGYNLYVKGGILTERVRVALAGSERWADYVFNKDYQLMSLKNVEKFIKANHHLPNVPSAEEMAKNGLDITETSAKLMEKIEELTLYLIEANKKIERLEHKVNTLEKK